MFVGGYYDKVFLIAAPYDANGKQLCPLAGLALNEKVARASQGVIPEGFWRFCGDEGAI